MYERYGAVFYVASILRLWDGTHSLLIPIIQNISDDVNLKTQQKLINITPDGMLSYSCH